MASPWQLQFPHLKTRLGHLLETKVLSDCSFQVGREGLVIAGHKVIIGMASPVLYEKIQKDPLEVVIADVEPDVFQDMLRYIYTDEVTISCSDTAYRLCKAAQIYQLPQLEKMCYHHISTDLTTKNVMQVYELAVCHKDDILTEKCEEILKTQTKKVLKESSFKSACLDAVVAMFSLDKLDVDSEIELLRALDRIANNENRKPSDNECETSTVRDALEKIRFLSLTPKEFAEGKAGLTVLPAHDACAVLANLVSSKSGLPMPENFSLMREPRKKRLVPVSEIKFQHRFEDFIKNKYNLNQLWVHNKVQDVPWKVHFNLEDHEDVLSFYAYCNWEEKTRDWSCNAEVYIKLIRSGNLDPLVKKYTHQFKRSSSNWGLPDIISWSDLVDPENKYLHDGALILEVTIKAEELIYLPKD